MPSAEAGTWLGVAAITWFSMLGFRLLIGGTTAAWGVEGTMIHARDLRGVRSVDTARLEQVHGARVRNRYLHLDVLVLGEEGGGTVVLRSDSSWRQGNLKANTLHVAHREVRKAVAAGRVRHVSKGAREVLGVPGPASDVPSPAQIGTSALLYAAALIGYGVALGVVVD